jgi:hypothetical protein
MSFLNSIASTVQQTVAGITNSSKNKLNTTVKAINSSLNSKNNSVSNKTLNVKAVNVKANVLVPNASKNNKTMKNKLNFGFKEGPSQSGGVAPTNFRYPADMQQPSEEIMEWATTAGAPTPIGPQMRNVAHGGRRAHHKKSHKKSHHKKSHKKSHHKKSHKKHTIRRNTMKKNRRN